MNLTNQTIGGRGRGLRQVNRAVHAVFETLETRRFFSTAIVPTLAAPSDSNSKILRAINTTLPVPSVIAPGNSASPGPTVENNTPVFTWHAVTSGVPITGFQLTLYDVAASKGFTYSIDATATSFALPSGVLVAGKKYVWNLRSVNGADTSAPSTYLYFQAPAAATLPAPVVIGPGTSTTPGPVLDTLTPTFTWTGVTGVTFTGYQLNLFDTTSSKSFSYPISSTATSFALPGGVLVNGDKYVWNLRLVNGSASGPPSTYLNFQAPPAAPTLPAPVVIGPGSSTAPGPAVDTLTPTFTWHAVTGVTFTAYQLTVYDTNTSKGTTYQVDPAATTFTLPSGVLVNGDKYVWNLRVLNGTASGPPSTYLYFQAPPAAQPLPAPVVISPGTNSAPGPVIESLTPTFTWTAVGSGVTFTGYQLNVSDTTSGRSYSYQISPTATSFVLPSGVLANGDKAVWNLRLVNGTVSGPPSTYLYFQAPAAPTLPVPVLISPGEAAAPGPVITTLTPTFTWTPITSGITGYELDLFDSTSGKSFVYNIDAGASSFALPGGVLANGDSYAWSLRVVNGTQKGKGNYLFFQAPPASAGLPSPVVIGPGTTSSPGSVLDALTPTFTWQAEPTSVTFTGFQLNLYDSTASKSYTYRIDPTATSFTLPSGVLVAGDKYVWNLRLVNGTQSGPPGTYLYFQAPAANPVPPANTIPIPVVIGPGSTGAPGPVLETITPTLTWKAVGRGISGLTLTLYDTTAAKVNTYSLSPTATSFTIPAGVLAPGDKYVWNLRGVDGSHSGKPSAYLFFQAPTPTIAVASLNDSLVTLRSTQTRLLRAMGSVVHSTKAYKHLKTQYVQTRKLIKEVVAARSDIET